jgi:uncharacterized protein (TIGR00255 family)
MSMTSMTGFARESVTVAGGELLWEIRTVNHRHLEMQFRLPENFRGLESDLRSALPRHARRGKLDATLSFRQAPDSVPQLRLNAPLAKSLATHAGELAMLLPDAAAIDPMDILRWPGVLEADDKSAEPLQAPALALFEKALLSLEKSRQAEGCKLGKLILDRCDAVDELATQARLRVPEVLAGLRERWRTRLSELDVPADSDRLEQEMALAMQKLDVTEELDRLAMHTVEVRNALNADEPAGRRIDFLIQELNRETNTLSAKSPDSDMTKIAIDMKVLVEQMREQSQNLE